MSRTHRGNHTTTSSPDRWRPVLVDQRPLCAVCGGRADRTTDELCAACRAAAYGLASFDAQVQRAGGARRVR